MRDTSALAEEINSARHRLVRSGSTRRSIQWRVTRSGYRLPAGGQMLRRINAALFEAPAGARIEIVAESQNNNGVTDARFEYEDRKSTRLNSSHVRISYAVFCLK